MAEPSVDDIQVQQYVYGLVAAPDFATNQICFAAHYQGLGRSTDSGVTWEPAFDSLGSATSIPATCVAVSPHFASDRVVIAGAPGGILTSHDAGVSWSSTLLPEPAPFVSTLALSPDFANDGTGFAGTMEDGVFLTSDRGRSWTAWNIGLLDQRALCLAVSPAFRHDRTLFVGTESGIFASANGGRFWRELAFPIENISILSLGVSPAFEHDQVLFAGTAAHGLFVRGPASLAWRELPFAAESSAVNSILVSPEYPAKPHLLVLLDDAIRISRDCGGTWLTCASDADWGDSPISAVAAPLGLDHGCPLLLGFVDGRIQSTTITVA